MVKVSDRIVGVSQLSILGLIDGFTDIFWNKYDKDLNSQVTTAANHLVFEEIYEKYRTTPNSEYNTDGFRSEVSAISERLVEV